MTEQHELMGGKLHVYRRDNSGYWQCSTYLAGKNWRVSTKEGSLAVAKQFAEDWYLSLRGKNLAGEMPTGRRFKQAADQFLLEYEVITAGERSPKYVAGMRAGSGFTCCRFSAQNVWPKSHRAWFRNIASTAPVRAGMKKRANRSDRHATRFIKKSLCCGTF
jgi:hypothetical protein